MNYTRIQLTYHSSLISPLSRVIILDADDVGFVGWVVWVHVLPDLRDAAPGVERPAESMHLTAVQVDDVTREKDLFHQVLLIRSMNDEHRAIYHSPKLRPTMVKLQAQPL